MSRNRLAVAAVAALALMAPALAGLSLMSRASAQAPASAIAGPGSADPRCDPQVREALAANAERGVEDELAIIRHPDQGIRDPDSILDFSCIADLFDYRAFDLLFDPAGALEDILDLARRRICAAARDAYRSYLGRTLDSTIYTVPARRLPGLDVDWRRRNVLGGVRAGSADSELFRGVVEGGQ